MKTIISGIIIGCFLLVLPILSNAHSRWIEVKGSGKINEKVQVSLFYGEYDKGVLEKGDKLDQLRDIKIYVIDAFGNKSDVVMIQTQTHWQGSFEPKTAGIYQILGVNDQAVVKDNSKKGQGFTRTIMYFRSTYTIKGKESQQIAMHNLDITVQKQSAGYLLTAYKGKQKQSEIKFTIINPDEGIKTMSSDEKGEALFTPDKKGLYLVTIEYIDKTKGNFKGKEYETLIYKHTMSMIVE